MTDTLTPSDTANIHADIIDPQTIKQRSITGAVAFVARTVALYGIGVIAFALLSGLLSTQEIGVFILVDATVSILIYFSDIGLGAALIQKKSPLTRSDLTTTFTIQQALVISLVTIAFLFSRPVAVFLELGPDAVSLYRALLVSFFLSSLKTIPSILLERRLDFNRLIIPQIFENLVFYTLVVFLAWQGQSINSYTYAVLARGVVGLVIIYLLQPWLPGFGIDRKAAKQLANFGAPFQLFSIMALIKDRVLIVFLGKLLGTGPLGLLGWAERWAQLPIRFFTDPVLRVTFPAYSRLQDNKSELKKAIEKSIYFVSFLTFPSIVGIIAIAPVVIDTVPRYAQWQPALLALTFYGINTMFSATSITMINTLNATGKVGVSLKLMVMWTVLTWILTPTLISFIGFNGAALASALTSASSLVAYFLVTRIVKISLLPQIIPPLYGSLAMYIFLILLRNALSPGFITLLLLVCSGSLIYLSIMLLTGWQRLFTEAKILKKYFKK